MAYRLKAIKVPTSNNMNFVMSVIFTDSQEQIQSATFQTESEFKSRFEEIFGFPMSELYLNVICGYNVNTDPDALRVFGIISDRVSNYMYVDGITFDMNGTLCRLHEDSSNNGIQYYDASTDIWLGGIGGGDNWRILPSVNKYGLVIGGTPVNTASVALYIYYVNDINNITYETWTESGGLCSLLSLEWRNDYNIGFIGQSSFSRIRSVQQLQMVEYMIGSRAVNPDDPYNQLDPSWEDGGGGSYNNNSDAIDDQTFNSSMASITGSAATIYATSSITDIDNFLNTLYGATMFDRITNIVNSIGSLGGKVTDYIMKFYMLPVNIGYSSQKYAFNTGWYDVIAPELMLPVATQRLKTLDMGSVKIDEYWGNALDYESNIEIYLPYIGYQQLDARAVMGKTLNVVYQIDVMSADCVAQIFVDGDVLYQFNGNCGYELPISADCRISDAIGKIASGVATVVSAASVVGG